MMSFLDMKKHRASAQVHPGSADRYQQQQGQQTHLRPQMLKHHTVKIPQYGANYRIVAPNGGFLKVIQTDAPPSPAQTLKSVDDVGKEATKNGKRITSASKIAPLPVTVVTADTIDEATVFSFSAYAGAENQFFVSVRLPSMLSSTSMTNGSLSKKYVAHTPSASSTSRSSSLKSPESNAKVVPSSSDDALSDLGDHLQHRTREVHHHQLGSLEKPTPQPTATAPSGEPSQPYGVVVNPITKQLECVPGATCVWAVHSRPSPWERDAAKFPPSTKEAEQGTATTTATEKKGAQVPSPRPSWPNLEARIFLPRKDDEECANSNPLADFSCWYCHPRRPHVISVGCQADDVEPEREEPTVAEVADQKDENRKDLVVTDGVTSSVDKVVECASSSPPRLVRPEWAQYRSDEALFLLVCVDQA